MSVKNQKIIVLFVCLIAIFCIFYFGQMNVEKRKREREEYKKYTIGTTIKSHIGLKQNSPSVYYKYRVNEVKYETYNKYNSDWNINYSGGNYIVQYSSLHPENAEILLKLGEVPDSIAYPLYFNSFDTIPTW